MKQETPNTDRRSRAKRLPSEPQAQAPESKEDREWEAHLELLKEYTPQDLDTQLRMIVQYARSGPFYPAGMHVQLIKSLITKLRIQDRIDELNLLDQIDFSEPEPDELESMDLETYIQFRTAELKSRLEQSLKEAGNETRMD